MDLFIVTGGSKGLGEQICKRALEQGHFVVNLSRSKPSYKHLAFKHLGVDLSKGLQASKKLQGFLNRLDLKDYKKIHLINNAGMISPVGALTKLEATEIHQHLQTNLVSPILLSQVVAQQAKAQKKSLVIFNIGSGASFYPIAGWSMYCTSKAGLKMFAEATSLDLKDQKNAKTSIYHFSPGVLDTQMQKQIRGFSKKDFPRVNEFKKLKADEQLRTPESVAQKIVAFCLNPKKFDIKDQMISIHDLEQREVQ